MEGWRYEALGRLCKTGAGGTPLKAYSEYYENGDINWLLSGEVNVKNIIFVKNRITNLGLENSSARVFPENTVLVAMYGATAGQVGILRTPSATNQAVCGIFPTDSYLPEFLYYYISFQKPYLLEQATGSAQPNISQVKIKNLTLPILAIPVQKAIVAKLDAAFASIDIAIAAAERNAENAKQLFQSYLSGVFERGGEGWVEKRLGEIALNEDSKRVPITKAHRKAGEYPYYGASGIVDYVAEYIFDGDYLLVSEDGGNLLARTYPIAFSVSGKSWVNNHAHVLRFNSLSLQKYVEFYLNSIPLNKFVNGMAQPKLNQAMLNSIPIPLPPPEMQGKLLATFEHLSSSIFSLTFVFKQKRNALSALKQSLLQQAFTG